MMRVKVGILAFCCYVCATIAFGQGDGGSDDDFKFSWEEKGNAGGRKPAQYENLIKEILTLKAKNRELADSLAGTKKKNATQVLAIGTLTRRNKTLVASVEMMKRREQGDSTQRDREQQTLREALAREFEEKSALKVRVAKLENDLRQRDREPVRVLPDPMTKERSGLIRRLEQEKLRLKKNSQTLTKALGRETRERRLLEQKTAQDTARIGDMRQKISDLENENVAMSQRQKDLIAQAEESVSRKIRIENLKQEAADREAALAQANDTAGNLQRSTGAIQAELTDLRAKLAVETKARATEKEDLYFNLGVLYVRTGNYEKAERSFVQVLKCRPSAPDLHFNLGILYDKYLRDAKKAALHYDAFIELAPDSDDLPKVKLWRTELDLKIEQAE